MTPKKTMPTRRWLITAFTLLLAGTVIHPAYAEEEAEEDQGKMTLTHLYKAQINAYYAINSFYSFSANQADQAQLEDVNESVSSVDESLNELDALLDEASDEALKTAKNNWSNYTRALDQNVKVVLKSGYTDLNLSSEMAVHNIETQNSLSSIYTSALSTAKSSDFEQLARTSAVTLALMMTKYSARTTSTVSQAYSAGENEKTIDLLANELDETLRKMITLAASKEEAARPLDSAWSKWEFIRESYINYNENRVNFVVNLYSRKIIDLLDESAANF